MKEFLEKQANGEYVLIEAYRKGVNDWIEVPKGAELYAKSKESAYVFFAKDNGETLSTFGSFHKNEWHKESTLKIGNIHINYDILWQRPQQPESLPFIDDEPKGQKHDSAKPRMSLLPKGVLSTVVSVLEFGARKYQEDNWKQVSNAKTRYYDAMQRHIGAWWDGEKNDPETGEHHLAHAICCAMFLIWFDKEDNK